MGGLETPVKLKCPSEGLRSGYSYEDRGISGVAHAGIRQHLSGSLEPLLQRGDFGRRKPLPQSPAPGQINNLFFLPRHCVTATDYRAARAGAFQTWHDVCGIMQAA